MGRCELGCRIPFPSPSYDSRSVLAVKGSLLRAKRAPLTAPGRSEAHNLYEGKGIRGTSHLSTISASAPQSAFHRSTVLKCGRLLARSWPVPPTRNPEEPSFIDPGCFRHLLSSSKAAYKSYSPRRAREPSAEAARKTVRSRPKSGAHRKQSRSWSGAQRAIRRGRSSDADCQIGIVSKVTRSADPEKPLPFSRSTCLVWGGTEGQRSSSSSSSSSSSRNGVLSPAADPRQPGRFLPNRRA